MTAIPSKFYNLFWTDPVCQSIFSVHKSQLLENEVELIITKEKFYARRLVLTNSQKRKAGSQIAKRRENENIELIHDLKKAAARYFNETQIEQYIKERFGKTIKTIETDIKKSGGWFKFLLKAIANFTSDSDLFAFLAEYHVIPHSIQNREQFNEYIATQTQAIFKDFLKKENLSDLALSIDLVSTYYNHKIKNNLVSASKHYSDKVYDKENFQSRLDLFDALFEIGAIKGGILKSYYECVSCPPNTLNGILTINIKPSSLKLKCPACSKELFYIVPYELDNVLYENIIDKDGLLFYAIQHLFEYRKYIFRSNVQLLSDVELDFCLYNDQQQICEIIEVKMFKTDRPDDTQIGNLRDAISKMKNATDKLTKTDVNFKKVRKSLVTNISAKPIYSNAMKELETELSDYNISMYDIPKFHERFKI